MQRAQDLPLQAKKPTLPLIYIVSTFLKMLIDTKIGACIKYCTAFPDLCIFILQIRSDMIVDGQEGTHRECF